MTTILLIILSFGSVIVIYGLFWKLAARILRYGGVTWPLAFLVAATIVFVSGFIRGVVSALKVGLPVLFAVPFSAAITIVIGAWCFHERATRQDAQVVGWPGALKLSALALVLFLLPAVLVYAVLLFAGD